MDDLQLKTILKAEIASATSGSGTQDELAVRLEEALKYYLGEPFGNEMEDRSQVVLTVTRDTIDWMMSQLMQVFEGAEEVVRFDPSSYQDKEQADVETDIVNHVFEKENNGFLIMYTWIKDALMQKNGIVKTYTDETEEEEKEKIQGLSDSQMAVIYANEDIELLEHTENVEYTEEGLAYSLHDVTLKRTNTESNVVIVNIPPEEFLISDNANTLFPEDADFTAHWTQKTRSDLKAEGFDPDIVDGLGVSNDDSGGTSVEIARDNLNTGTATGSDLSVVDEARREVDVYECYLRVDYDDDGYTELRKVTYAGDEILLNEEVDGNPFSVICPNILPHKFHGLSVADDTMDLQLVESIIMRNVLDNLYAANNQRTVVNQNVNLDDMLTSRPNGVIRTTGMPGQDVMPLQHTPIINEGLSMIDYLDGIKEQRTGVGKTFQGQNQDIAGQTAHGTERIMTAAEKKVDLIARIFAETGIRHMFLKVREELHKHGKVKTYFLNDKDVEIDPTSWKDRKSATVKVGLGTGDRRAMAGALAGVVQSHDKLVQMGGLGTFVTPENIYRAYIDLGKYAGLPCAESYYTDPATVPPKPQQPPPPDPTLVAIEATKQLEQAKLAAKAQGDEAQREYDAQEKQAELASKEAIEAMKVEADLFKEGARVDVGPEGFGTLPNS